MTSEKDNRGIILLLIIALLIVSFLSYLNYKDYSRLRLAFNQEKLELEKELEVIITDYDDMLANKLTLSNNYSMVRRDLVNLKDTLKELREKNYNLLGALRKKVNLFQEQNELLSKQVDSLSDSNQVLMKENFFVKSKLTKSTKEKDDLTKALNTLKDDQKELEYTIGKAKQLMINDFSVTPMKLKSSGKYVETSRRKRIVAFRVSFGILENRFTDKGNKKVYVQILDQKNRVVSKYGDFLLNNGVKVGYSKKLTVNYDNRSIGVAFLVDIDNLPISEGKYLVTVFLEGRPVGNRIITI